MFFITLGVFAHAPQFADEFPMTLQHGADISQVTYFKPKGSMQGLLIKSATSGTLVQAVFRSERPEGQLHVGCVENSTQIPPPHPLNTPNRSVESSTEPFTQTRYHTFYDSTIPADCERFAVYGEFSTPWAAVVGKKESFSPTELVMFPVYSAKLHGSWWNDNYVYHWPFLVALIVGLCYGFRPFVIGLFVASAANRFAHAWTLVGLADLIPAALIMYPNKYLWFILVLLVAISAAVLSSWWIAAIIAILGVCFPRFGRGFTLLFAVGSGYLIGPIAYIVDLSRDHYICRRTGPRKET